MPARLTCELTVKRIPITTDEQRRKRNLAMKLFNEILLADYYQGKEVDLKTDITQDTDLPKE